MIPLPQISLVGVINYKRSFTSQSTMLAGVAEVHSGRPERAGSSERETEREEIFSNIPDSSILKVRVKKLSYDTCSAKERTARNV